VNKYKCEFAFPSTSVYIEKNQLKSQNWLMNVFCMCTIFIIHISHRTIKFYFT
jgi:hypothetical protein